MPDFTIMGSQLEEAVNLLSIDNEMNVPDHILGRYLSTCLQLLHCCIQGRQAEEDQVLDFLNALSAALHENLVWQGNQEFHPATLDYLDPPVAGDEVWG